MANMFSARRSLVAALLLVTPHLSTALPAPEIGLEERNTPLACLAVDVVVGVLHNAPSATAFCSSYLGIQTQTVYTTTTQSLYTTQFVTSTTGTNTVTAPTSTAAVVTASPVTTDTVTYTQTADASTVTVCSTAVAPAKRNSQPEKVPQPACLNGLVAAEVSLACSCLAVPTPTFTSTITNTAYPTTVVTSDVAATATTTPVTTPYYTPTITPSTTITVTPTSTVSYCPSPTADTSCGNQGAQWAYYPNPFGTNSDGSYSQFDPTVFKTETPVVDGVAASAGGISGNCPSAASTVSFYGDTESCYEIVLDYRGYLYAAQAGTFTFSVSSADDIVLIWAGPEAYSGWTRDNALLVVTYPELGGDGAGAGGSISGVYPVTAGEYVPVRIMFGQGDGPFGFNVQVTAPDGTVILSADSSESPDLVQYSCDGTSAPQYPPWGSET